MCVIKLTLSDKNSSSTHDPDTSLTLAMTHTQSPHCCLSVSSRCDHTFNVFVILTEERNQFACKERRCAAAVEKRTGACNQEKPKKILLETIVYKKSLNMI